MGNEFQQWISLGLGGVLISLVAYSIWRLIGAWMTIASTERDSGQEAQVRADHLQEKLNAEIMMRVALEVEVKFLRKELEALKKELVQIEEKWGLP